MLEIRKIENYSGGCVNIHFSNGISAYCYIYEDEFYINNFEIGDEFFGGTANCEREQFKGIVKFFEDKGCKYRWKHAKNVFYANKYLKTICLL